MNSSLAKFLLLLSMCVREEWSMWEMASSVDLLGRLGKLKRVQSNRDGGANVALNKSLKNLHDYWCEGHWTIVIQARGFIDDGFFKGGGNHRGSKGLIEDWSEQTSKLISAGPQDTASNPVRSGRFPYVHSLKGPANLVLWHSDHMIIASLHAASWHAARQSPAAAIAFKAAVEGV